MELTKNPEEETKVACNKMLLPVQDALAVLNGRWKLPIIVTLTFGTRRFKEISKEVKGITDKMLSKELKNLELNKLIKRSVYDTFPPTVNYSLTKHGESLHKVIRELGVWGISHRKKIFEK